MRRRDFIALLSGAVTAWPLAVRTQQLSIPVIGFLHSGVRDLFTGEVAGFHQGLNEAGYVEGKNVAIDFRWANNQIELLPALADGLVRRRVAVIFAAGGALPPREAKAATSTIPVVFAFGDDPMQHGLVASWNRPGGNVTGVTTFSGELAAKRFQLLCELVPQATTIAYIFDPRAVTAEQQTSRVLAAAGALGRQVITLEARSEGDFDAAFATLLQRQADALFVGPYPLFYANRDKILTLAARHKIPAMYSDRAYTMNGGLMSYGSSFAGNYRRGAVYVGNILKGAKPADLPVQQATKFELVINLTTVKALGLTVPRHLRVLADLID
jgi:putative ABC transport system substrate-binding protein